VVLISNSDVSGCFYDGAAGERTDVAAHRLKVRKEGVDGYCGAGSETDETDRMVLQVAVLCDVCTSAGSGCQMLYLFQGYA
jgi:hypothetical protein